MKALFSPRAEVEFIMLIKIGLKKTKEKSVALADHSQ